MEETNRVGKFDVPVHGTDGVHRRERGGELVEAGDGAGSAALRV